MGIYITVYIPKYQKFAEKLRMSSYVLVFPYPSSLLCPSYLGRSLAPFCVLSQLTRCTETFVLAAYRSPTSFSAQPASSLFHTPTPSQPPSKRSRLPAPFPCGRPSLLPPLSPAMSELYGENEPMMRHSLGDDTPLPHGFDGEDDSTAGAAAEAEAAHLARIQERRERPRAPSTWTMVKRALRAAFAEFVGTFVLGFVTLSTVATASLLDPSAQNMSRVLVVACAYGFAYGSLVYALSYDGAAGKPNVRQLNPALTVTLTLLGRMRVVDGLTFLCSQYAGAWLAIAAVLGCYPDKIAKMTLLGTEAGRASASVLVGMLLLLLVTFTFFDRVRLHIRQGDSLFTHHPARPAAHPHREQRPQSQHETNCLLALASSTACAGVLAPVSHDFCNPALSLGVCYLTSQWDWIPLAGPFIAALAAAIVGKLCDWQFELIRGVFADPARGAVNGGGAAGAHGGAGAGAGAGAGGAGAGQGKPRGARRAAGAGAVQMGPVMDDQYDDL